MDLSFARPAGHDPAIVTALPAELAVLLAGVVGRQAVSPTARVQNRIAHATSAPAALLAPVGGAFSALTAAAIRRWKGV